MTRWTPIKTMARIREVLDARGPALGAVPGGGAHLCCFLLMGLGSIPGYPTPVPIHPLGACSAEGSGDALPALFEGRSALPQDHLAGHLQGLEAKPAAAIESIRLPDVQVVLAAPAEGPWESWLMQEVLGKARSRLGLYPRIANQDGPNRGGSFPGQRDLCH
jgi:hypothetical protein